MDDYYPDPDSMYEERTHLADEDTVGDDDYWDNDDYWNERWDDDYDYQEDPL